ncbi:hypothetical protein CIFRMM109B1_11385 [Citrobacter freundii]|nr:hypothetical protein C2U38_02670 [Citrobacter freundii complex sp. CFNIH3]POV71258.1 hypothetical protein C3411_09540 [Citrobacter freundii complex sp. CFNIH5]
MMPGNTLDRCEMPGFSNIFKIHKQAFTYGVLPICKQHIRMIYNSIKKIFRLINVINTHPDT